MNENIRIIFEMENETVEDLIKLNKIINNYHIKKYKTLIKTLEVFMDQADLSGTFELTTSEKNALLLIKLRLEEEERKLKEKKFERIQDEN